MCGIVGILAAAPPGEVTLRRMMASIRHRGPDDGGTWIDTEAGAAPGQQESERSRELAGDEQRDTDTGCDRDVAEDQRTVVMTGRAQSLSAHYRFASDGSTRLKKILGDRDEAEVRRLFYVAVTRAKTEVVFVCNSIYRNDGFLKCLGETFGFANTGSRFVSRHQKIDVTLVASNR